MNYIYLPVKTESRSTECDCSIKLKEYQEEMKALYAQLDERVCVIGQQSLESIHQTLEDLESVKSPEDKKYQELYATICQLTSYDELKAEKEALEKSSNWNIEIMRDENKKKVEVELKGSHSENKNLDEIPKTITATDKKRVSLNHLRWNNYNC